MGRGDGKVLPMLGLKERPCKMKFAHIVKGKGPHEHAIEQVCEDVHSKGDPSGAGNRGGYRLPLNNGGSDTGGKSGR